MKISLIIADDHPIVRYGFTWALALDGQMEVLAEASNGEELLQLLKTHKPHVILLDVYMPVMNGIEAGKAIREKYPDVKLLALSMNGEEETVRAMLHIGVHGYLLKNARPEEVLQAVRTVHSGGRYYSVQISKTIDRLLNPALAKSENGNGFAAFTEKELRMLALICEGASHKQIADVIGLAYKTVEHAIERMREKTATKNTAELAAYAVKNGLVSKGKQ